MRLLALPTICGLLSACSVMPTPQFAGASIPLAADYREAARKVAAQMSFVTASTRITAPRQLPGETALDPQRWYVCMSDRPAGTHDLIVIFYGGGLPATLDAHGSPLCVGLPSAPL